MLKKLFKSKVAIIVGILAILVVVIVSAIGIYAADPLATQTVTGGGTISVSTPPVYSFSLYRDSACTLAVTTIDFSGPVTIGTVYSKSVVIDVKNTGTDGTNGGALASINSMAVTVAGLPNGWTFSASPLQSTPVAVGVVQPMTLTLSSIATITSTTTLPTLTFTFSAN